MRLREIIFQGIFGRRAPARLAFESNVATVELPAGVEASDVQAVVTSLMYPQQMSHAIRMEYASASDVKVALVFDHAGKTFRLLRRKSADSLRLQIHEDGSWAAAANSEVEVRQYLQQSLSLPAFAPYWTVNLWRFQEDPTCSAEVDMDALDSKVRDVIAKYRISLRVEGVEDAIKETESKISECNKDLGTGAALEEKLRKARGKLDEIAVAELTDDDLEVLRKKDERMSEYDHQVGRLEAEEDTERRQVDMTLPDRPWRVPLFWVGVVIGIVSLAASAVVDPGMRAVALVDIVGFSMVAWVMLSYFSDMERASVHQVRLESIKRRLNQVREEQVTFVERVNHMLIHAGVRDARELEDRIHKADRLRDMIAQMDDQARELRRDPDYQRAAEQVEKLEKRLRELQERRKEMPSDVLSSYQLETDLQDLGIDPTAVVEDSEPEVVEEPDDEEADPIDRLVEAAAELGQWDGRQLHPRTRKMWAKICSHVLGERFGSISLDSEERMTIGDLGPEQMEIWRRTRPSEHHIALLGLALAVAVNAPACSSHGALESILVPDPSRELTAPQKKKLHDVFGSASRRCSVALLAQSAS